MVVVVRTESWTKALILMGRDSFDRGKKGTLAQDEISDVLPDLKKAKADGKIAGAGVSTRGVGAGADEVVVTTYSTSWLTWTRRRPDRWHRSSVRRRRRRSTPRAPGSRRPSRSSSAGG